LFCSSVICASTFLPAPSNFSSPPAAPLAGSAPPSFRPFNSTLNRLTVPCNHSRSSHPSSRAFTTALFLMFRARFAYLSVFTVSPAFHSAGLTHAIMSVCALPPRESCSRRVSLESRYGTCDMCALAREGSPRAEMTFPRARRPELMEMPSLTRSPAAAVRFSCGILVVIKRKKRED
jgi:hypothetical protein